MAIPGENAPNADDTARVGEPNQRVSPMTMATPQAPRTATSGSSRMRSIVKPAWAVCFSACDQLIRRDYDLDLQARNRPPLADSSRTRPFGPRQPSGVAQSTLSSSMGRVASRSTYAVKEVGEPSPQYVVIVAQPTRAD